MTISGKTQLLGVMGWPISHSLSPAMHNAAAAALGLDVAYVPLAVRPEEVAAALRGLVALGFRGVNVTVPHKEVVMAHLDSIFPAARDIGAVNTIAIHDGKLTGFNTDWSGFLADLRRHALMLEGGRPCLVLGAGGSARAVAYALLRAGAEVTIAARRPEQAQRLATELGMGLTDTTTIRVADLAEAPALAAHMGQPIIVNTTPLGMAGPNADASPWPDGAPFPRYSFVYDLIYNPPMTKLLQAAAAAGCGVGNGLGMLVNQAAEAFEIWLGVRPDVEVMSAALPATFKLSGR